MARIIKTKAARYGLAYEVRWSWYDAEGKRHFKKERFRTQEEAKAKKREVEDAVAAASLPDYKGGKASVNEWGERWLATKRTLRKPSTVRSYEAIWNADVKRTFGARRINTITTADVQEWITGLLARGLTPPTVKHHVWVLGQIFAAAARARAITYNPVRDCELPTDRSVGRLKPEPRFLTAEQVETLAAKLDAVPPYGLLIRFMAWTGLRTAEVSGLNVADVDLMHNVVRVGRTRSRRGGIWTEHTPKSGKARRVPLMPWIADDLRAYLDTHPHADDPTAPLWPGTRPGGYSHGKKPKPAHKVQTLGSPRSGSVDYDVPFEPGTFYRRRYQPALTAVGLPSGKGGVRLHDLRHTFGSLAASRGIDPSQIASWMGHASDVITRQVYLHLYDADTKRAAEVLASGGRPTATPPATVTELRGR